MFARRLLLSAAAFVLGFLAVEGVLRADRIYRWVLGDPFLEESAPSIRLLVPDAFLQWRGRADHRPGWVEKGLNERGYRGPTPGPTKRAGVQRIAVLGDSCTFGVVRRREVMAGMLPYPERLQRRLDQDPGSGRFEVINYGVIGYTSYHGLRLLRKEVLPTTRTSW